jgi:ATP dependent DNA ligase domain
MVKRDLRPMLATLTDKPFDGADWVFETKWDGFRALAVAAPNHAALYSRNGHDISQKYPTISAALAKDSPRGGDRWRNRRARRTGPIAFLAVAECRPQFGIAALAAEIHETLKVP